MTDHAERLERLDLKRNPFPPAATGPGLVDDLSLPERWTTDLNALITKLAQSQGNRVLVIEGAYGAGKTFILNWLRAGPLPAHRVHPYLFENPGVAFYDLANRLMRQVGRHEVAKALWEMLYPNDPEIRQQLFAFTFKQWLAEMRRRRHREEAIDTLSKAIKDQDLATDDEIANKLARLVVETGEHPYFEYRDFVPRSSRSLVAEQEEPQYFQSLIKILGRIIDADGIAFLLDEFEDVPLSGRRLNRSQAANYTNTLRRLLDVAQSENLWIILSTTPEGLERTRELEEALVQRFSDQYTIPNLTRDDAYGIVERRLKSARIAGSEGLWPFTDDSLDGLAETSLSIPRRLIKIMWQAVALATERGARTPLTGDLVMEAEKRLYEQPLET